MAPDGRFVAFVSAETDLALGVADTNGTGDVFLRDLQMGTTRLVSVNAAGNAAGNRRSGTAQYPFDFSNGAPVLSDDGRFVAFASEATDLAPGQIDNNDLAADQPGEQPGMRRRDVFVRDMQANTTTMVSMNRAGTGTGNNGSYTPAMSADGRAFAFESHASDLVAGQDNGGFQDVFVRDLDAGETELASKRTALFPPERLRGGTLADVTADGRFAAFLSAAAIVPNVPIEFGPHLYVRDRLTGQVSVEDVAGGVAREGFPRAAQLSDDGQFIVFGSAASLDPNVGDPNRRGQLYVRDRQVGTTRMVTTTAAGQASDGVDLGPRDFAFSSDGRYVAFTTQSGEMVAGFTDNNGSDFGLGRDVFIRDLVAGTTRLVSHVPASATSGGNGSSFWPVFSADGTKLAFASLASDLAAGVSDTNNGIDLFVYDVATGQIEAASVVAAGNSTGDAASGNVADTLFSLSADGRYLIFGSSASNLVAGDNNAARDIFRRDLVADTTTLVSAASGGGAANSQSYGLSASANGNLVAFTSDANDLVAGDSNIRSDIFVRDINAGTTTLVSAGSAAPFGNNTSFGPIISPEGSHVAFLSQATNLVPDFVDLNSEFRADVFVRRIADGVTALVTASNTGITGSDTGNLPSPFHFAAGDTLFFDTDAGKLFNGDRNALTDVFAYTAAGAARISGRVFNDADGSGSPGAGESGIPFWTVFVDTNNNGQFDAGELNRQTDLAGIYRPGRRHLYGQRRFAGRLWVERAGHRNARGHARLGHRRNDRPRLRRGARDKRLARHLGDRAGDGQCRTQFYGGLVGSQQRGPGDYRRLAGRCLSLAGRGARRQRPAVGRGAAYRRVGGRRKLYAVARRAGAACRNRKL
jgi:Tol biopolymer transport system component